MTKSADDLRVEIISALVNAAHARWPQEGWPQTGRDPFKPVREALLIARAQAGTRTQGGLNEVIGRFKGIVSILAVQPLAVERPLLVLRLVRFTLSVLEAEDRQLPQGLKPSSRALVWEILSDFEIGEEVHLKANPAAGSTVINLFYDDIEGGVRLDEKLDNHVSWNVADLGHGPAPVTQEA